jgi:hypothetical protein
MFEDLIGLKLNENEIIKIVCTRAQANYSKLKEGTYHYLELAPCEKKVSEVIGFKLFSQETIKPYFFSHKTWPVCVMFKLKKGLIEVRAQGGFIDCSLKMDANITTEYRLNSEHDEYEPWPMIDQELFEKGFAELNELAADSFKKKAV